MANEPLESIKFPGIANTFTVPAVDNTLAVQGAPADAKKVGDEISDIKAELSEKTINLCDVSKFAKGGVIVSDGIVTGTAQAFNSAFGSSGVPLDIEWEENTQYTFSFECKNDNGGSGNGLTIGFVYTDETQQKISVTNETTNYTLKSITSASGKTISKVILGYVNQGAYVWHLKNVQIEKSETRSAYIPFVTAVDHNARNNISSINTEMSALSNDISSLKNEFQLMNSVNLFRKAKTETKTGITYTSEGNGCVKLSGSNSADVYFDASVLSDIDVETDKDYWVFYGSPSKTVSYLTVYFNTGSGYKKECDICGLAKIHTPPNMTDVLIRIYAKANAVFDNTSYRLTVSEARSNLDLEEKSAELRFLCPFGTGDCTIIKFNDGTVLVIDFGLAEQQHTLHRSWKRAVADLGITHIDYAIISHYHSDHVGLLIDTDTTDADYVDITNYIDSNTTFYLPQQWTAADIEGIQWTDTMTGSGVYDNYVAVNGFLQENGCKVFYPTEDEKVMIGGAEIQFWNADHSDYLDQYKKQVMYDYNHCSLCNYLTLGDERICFTGDAGPIALEKYKTSALPSQIFKVNHHSNGYQMVPLFMNCIMPEVSVSMLGHSIAVGTFATNPNQIWHEENHVPHINTGINSSSLSLHLSEHGYKWNTPCRRCIRADEGLTE